MADISAKEYAAQITTELRQYIPFLRDRWREFCTMVERNAEQLASYQEKHLGEKQRIIQKYPRSFFPNHEEYKRVRDAGDTKKVEQLKKIAEKNEAKFNRIQLEMDERKKKAEKQGWVTWDVNYDTQYLKLPVPWLPGECFYAPPHVVNPLLWILDKQGNPRRPTPEESLLCDYAILCYMHDHNISASEQPVYPRATYTGKYFACDDFSSCVWPKERLERAFNNVKPYLDEWRKSQTPPTPAVGTGGGGAAKDLSKRGKDVLKQRVETYLKSVNWVSGLSAQKIANAINAKDVEKFRPTSRGAVADTPAYKRYNKRKPNKKK